MKRIILSAFTLLLIFVLTSFTSDNSTTKPTEKVRYYAYGYTWSNRDLNGKSENGSDGVAYVSNVTSFTVDRYSTTSSESIRAWNYANNQADRNFAESFESHYSKAIYSTYYSGGVNGVYISETREEVEKRRRKTIADYKSDDAIVRYFNSYEVYD